MRWAAPALLVGATLLVFVPVASAAELDTAETILAHAEHLRETTWKWTDRVQRLELQIVDRRGGVRERSLDVYYKKYEGDRSRSILFFKSPPEVKGTGFLQWVDPHDRNQQWLWLPALKRVRQISGSSQRDSFMGTDFSYEDLAIITEILDWSASDAPRRLVGRTRCGAEECWQIEYTPRGKDVAYGSIVLWLDAGFQQRHFDFFDADGEKVKELEASEIRPVGAIPTAFRLEMKNLRSNSKTVVQFEEVTYDTGLSDSLFSQRRLEKGL